MPSVVTVAVDKIWHYLKSAAKLWSRHTHDVDTRRTVPWILGKHDDAACGCLPDNIATCFVTDEWKGNRRLIPQEQVLTGKDLAFHSAGQQHYFTCFRRQTKIMRKHRTTV